MRQLLMTGEGHRQVLRACSAAGITPGALKMAMFLSAETPHAMSELAQRFSVDASYVTAVVDGLEQHGIAERRPHPSDRRVKTVVLTDHGSEVLAEVSDALGEPPAAFGALTGEEQGQLRDLLQKVVDAATESPTSGERPEPVGNAR